MVLAACEGTTLAERVGGTLLAVAITAFWFGMAWYLVWLERDREERRGLFVILFLAACAAALPLTIFHNGLGTLLFLALATTLVVGAGGAYLLRLGPARAVGTALIGGSFLPLAVLVLIILATFLGGACLGEELG